MRFRTLAALLALAASRVAAAADTKPNVVLIMTDDQDKHLDSLSVMPNVNSLIGDQGVRYDNHYCTVAWCCPSRVNLLTGRAAHNTNVTTLNLPFGGWPKFLKEGLNDNWLPTWISAAGARTYYLGKLMNSYQHDNWHNPYPKGWTNSSFLVDPNTYEYFNSTWTNGNGSAPLTTYKGQHTTHVTEKKALEFIDDAANSGEQFFLMITPVAPHAQMLGWGAPQSPPPPPAEFKNLFSDRIAPRSPNFNPDDPSGASWVYKMPKQNDITVARNDEFHRHRLRNLAGVDAMVSGVISKLSSRNLLDNTYIIYTSDNGFHIGNHRLNPGKRCGFEEDINIPLLIRGPGVPKNVTTNITNSHTDIAPTILSMMGIDLQNDFDGEPIATTQPDLTNSTKYEHVNVEFFDSPGSHPWGSPHVDDGDEDGKPGTYYNNTYKSLRINSFGHQFYYSVWCSGEKEFYDMNADYYQMNNLLRSPNSPDENIQYFSRPYDQLIARLDALLMVLKSCKQDSCRDPYNVLFPKGEVQNLTAMMDKKYDKYFADSPKVQFVTCYTGHIQQLEGPIEIKAFGSACKRGVSAAAMVLLASGWGVFYGLLH